MVQNADLGSFSRRDILRLSALSLISLGFKTPLQSIATPALSDQSLQTTPFLTSTPAAPVSAREWYDRLWMAIEKGPYPDPNVAASSGNLYALGRTLRAHIDALMFAFRVTDDFRLLDEADRLMELARAQLADTNGDGYLNWRWLNDPDEKRYYGTDLHVLDEMMTHSLVAAHAYVLWQHQDVNPTYRTHADFWLNYLQHDFIAKWMSRGAELPLLLSKPDAHAQANWVRFHYYLWRMTGDEQHWEAAQVFNTRLMNMMVVQPDGAFTWDMQVPPSTSMGCQNLTYSRYTLEAFVALAVEGFAPYSDFSYMQRYAGTVRRFLLPGENVAQTPCTTQPDTSPGKYAISNYTALAAWDNTGELAARAEALYPQFTNSVFLPADMVFALRWPTQDAASVTASGASPTI